MNKGVSYNMFYDILLNLRNTFHSYGRIDDSNAKLDELVKLICISYSMALRNEHFGLEYIRKIAFMNFGDPDCIAKALRFSCSQELQTSIFQNPDGTNIFGTNPTLSIQPTENTLAETLISEIEKIDFVYLIQNKSYAEFDLINECFSHFVRENFRNNKEDAQYMTPHEVSDSILDIIFDRMDKDKYFSESILNNFYIMDPTCGVGTLLIDSSTHFTKYLNQTVSNPTHRQNIIERFRNHGILGQDKVDRMVRLSKINALLLGSNSSNICVGNSIIGKSTLHQYFESIDLIFTNPPFGAEYDISELQLNEFPILNSIKLSTRALPSELLMIDRCISLLKAGGYLAIILPDSVFSSKGIYSAYRDYLIQNYNILGVIGLPPVTFAQAGTRTNTCVLLLKKEPPTASAKTFMADCKDLGYVVKERMGVPIKLKQGTNQLPLIASSIAHSDCSSSKILNIDPSVTAIKKQDYIENILKPSFYAASRFQTIGNLENFNTTGYKIAKLGEIVDFVSVGRKSHMVSNTIKHISVLHINSDCTINFNDVEHFTPVSKGRECYPGELIFSKINPRIPRMAVVPEYHVNLVCSNEFEIMRSNGTIGMYTLCYLLKTTSVLKQIESLTSGTSSSHSRIKREQLANILIPVPDSEDCQKYFSEIEHKFSQVIDSIYSAENQISQQLSFLNHIA